MFGNIGSALQRFGSNVGLGMSGGSMNGTGMNPAMSGNPAGALSGFSGMGAGHLASLFARLPPQLQALISQHPAFQQQPMQSARGPQVRTPYAPYSNVGNLNLGSLPRMVG